MPYKFNESRRHRIPKARYRVTNRPEYDAALIRRASLTLWFTEDAVAAWHTPVTRERGGQPIYAAIAIETGLALGLVFYQPLRQTENLLRSIADVLGIAIAIPDHTTLSRLGGGMMILPKHIDRLEPLHLLIDSTGLKIYGEGESLDQEYGIRSRQKWRKSLLGPAPPRPYSAQSADRGEMIGTTRFSRQATRLFSESYPLPVIAAHGVMSGPIFRGRGRCFC
jgi:hypothetical protein